MATTQLTREQILGKYASLSDDAKEVLLECAYNYMFTYAVANHFNFNEIHKNDILFKALDFVAQGWTIENAVSSQWRYIA